MAVDSTGLRWKLVLYRDRVAQEALTDRAKELDSRVPRDTNTLADAQQLTKVGQDSWRVWYPVNYASYTDKGNAEGGAAMVPVRAKVLSFVVGGARVFTKRVQLSSPGWWSDVMEGAGAKPSWVALVASAVRRVTGF